MQSCLGGHEIENNTLNQLDMADFSYEQIYKEIQLSNEVIEKKRCPPALRPHKVRRLS
uniref:hypothetical protein n=1 Tax=Sporosarcina sp. FSL K6-1522 TaxID=2921554 RepID=UPI00406CB795